MTVTTEIPLAPRRKQYRGRVPKSPTVLATTDVSIVMKNGAEITFKVSSDASRPSYFSLGIRKSGSTLLHKIVGFSARQVGLSVVDLPGEFFRNGFTVADWKDLDLKPALRPGNVYTGFRHFPRELSETDQFKNSPKVLMYRDPRDALVSQYFSDAYSHSMPPSTSAGTGGRELFLEKRREALASDIDTWVLARAIGLRNTLWAFRDVLNDPTCLSLRYEDFVFQKRRLIAKITQHFGWDLLPRHINQLLTQVDVIPDREQPELSIRKAIPGDHVTKLQPETIRRLNHRLQSVLKLYDYY